MQEILASFSTVLKHLDGQDRAAEPIVFAAWKHCVDGALAENVVPLRLENDRLIVAVANETWRRNVADLGPELAARINRTLGTQSVAYIDFRVDALAVTEHRKSLLGSRGKEADQESNLRQITPALRASAESIADEELRDQFLAAAAGSLARRKRTEE